MSIRLALNCTLRWSYVRPTYVGTGVHFSRYTFCSQDYKLSTSREFTLHISVLFFCSCFVFSQHPILSGFTALNWMSQQHPFLADIIIQTVSQIFTIRLPEPCFVLKTVLLHCTSYTVLAFPSLTSLSC